MHSHASVTNAVLQTAPRSSSLLPGSCCLLDFSLCGINRHYKNHTSKPVAHHSSPHPETCFGTTILQLPKPETGSHGQLLPAPLPVSHCALAITPCLFS